MKKIIATIALLLISITSFALELQDAKNMGLIGERPDGYLGLVVTDNLKAAELITEINAKRKAKYQEIANKQNTPLSNIEKIAGEKLIKKAQKAGDYYMNDTLQWAQ